MKNNSFFSVVVAILMSVVLTVGFAPTIDIFADEIVSDNAAVEENLVEEEPGVDVPAIETSMNETPATEVSAEEIPAAQEVSTGENTTSTDAISISSTKSDNEISSYNEIRQEDSTFISEVSVPDSNLRSYTINVDENVYEIKVTRSVPYNGKYHVRKTAKGTKKQSPDLTVEVYRNGSLVKSGDYSIKYHNNLNINNYGALRTERRCRTIIQNPIVPHLNIMLKNKSPYKDDREIVADRKINFTIAPVDISTANFTVKKVRLTNTDGVIKFSLDTPTIMIGGKKFRMTPQDKDDPLTGSYSANYSNGKITVDGVNNFIGSTTIDLMSAKAMDYIF